MDDSKILKEYWYIAELCAGLQKKQDTDSGEDRFNKQIGNRFESEEEAELAIRKLKALVQLEDKGFEFDGIGNDEHGRIYIKTNLHSTDFNVLENPDLESTLQLLFGGEE